MIAPCSLSGYLWRRYWVRFRALAVMNQTSHPPSTICLSTIAGMPSWPFRLRRHCPVYQQILGAVSGLLGTAEAFSTEKGIAPEDIIQARLAADMLPFAYQVKSAAVHSLGAIEGVRRGVFTPDVTRPPTISRRSRRGSLKRSPLSRRSRLPRSTLSSVVTCALRSATAH